MLARAYVAQWPTQGYERLEHPVQHSCLETVAHWCDTRAGEIPCGIDGCGVVVYTLPLDAMALAYARFARDARAGAEVPARIASAVRTRPFLLGGSDRFDTIVIEETGGRVLPKIGAEGVHSVALLEQGIGIAVKVEDGAARAQFPAVIRLLQRLGELPDPLPPRLLDFASPRVRNTRGEIVGEVRIGRA
jgi:L-asparaginase II